MATDSQSGSSRTRSPAYPSIPLRKALDRAQELYAKERRNWAHVDVALSHWGYDPKSGVGLRAIAALKQFGLLDDEGKGENRRVRLTDLAYLILTPGHSTPEGELMDLQRAALLPPLHQSLWLHYNRQLPSDAALKRYLVLEKNFNDSFVDAFIRQFRATLAFAQIVPGDKIEESNGDHEADEVDDEADGQKPLGRRKRSRSMAEGTKQDIYTLDEGDVVLEWPAGLSEQSLEEIEDWLKLMLRKLKRSVKEAAPADE